MTKRLRVLKLVGAAVFGVASVGTFLLGGVRPTEAQTEPAYPRLQQAAARGDQWAKDYLARVDALLAAQGKSTPPAEVSVGRADTVNATRVSVKGVEPFYLKIHNHLDGATLRDVESYIVNRKAALAQLSGRDANREIEVAVSPVDYLELPKVWQLKAAHSLDIDEMIVAVFVRGERHSVMSVGDPKDPGEQPIIDLTAPVEVVEGRLRQLIPAQAFPGGQPGPQELTFKLVRLRGKMRAADAGALGGDASVLLVDPVTDLLDAYRGRAVDVRVSQVPNVLEIKKRLESGSVAPAPSAVPQATPTPSRGDNR